MRIAIFSDVHGNLEALETVLASIIAANCDKVICLGDTVGYGPNPRECIKLLRERKIPCILGNHDEAAASDAFPYRMNSVAQKAILWTQQQLSHHDKGWLRSLPYVILDNDATFVHSNIEAPDDWEYVTSSWVASRNFARMKTRFAFIGHTHEPMAWIEHKKGVKCEKFDRLPIEPETEYIINVGSVGQPRDGDPLAAYLIFDLEASRFELKRVAYDIEQTQAKIIDADLPIQLAQRLERGW
jgi:diadenosine tetraphosphatase ApaH/serine/threonine PP2A family protein phosphatase